MLVLFMLFGDIDFGPVVQNIFSAIYLKAIFLTFSIFRRPVKPRFEFIIFKLRSLFIHTLHASSASVVSAHFVFL